MIDIKKIAIVTVFGKFSQSINYHTSLKLDLFVSELESEGFPCVTIDLFDAMNNGLPKGCGYIIVGGHPDQEAHRALCDFSYVCEKAGIKVLPSLDTLLCYENKGLQGLLSLRYDYAFVRQSYHCSPDVEFQETRVYKTVSGAGSSGVALVTNPKQILKLSVLGSIKLVKAGSALRLLKMFLASFILESARARFKVLRPHVRFVLQRFQADLDYDYKVIVFFNRVYVLKRYVRDGDFRASGSGNFFFEEPSEQLLNFSLEQTRKINVPYLAMDIIPLGDEYKIIEFQSVHFGPYTQVNAEYYYEKSVDGWQRCKADSSLEQDYAHAISTYLLHI